MKALRIIAAFLLPLAAVGCTQSLKKPDEGQATTAPVSNTNTPEAKNEPDVRGNTMLAIAEVQTVNFDYDSASLKPDARATLKANAHWLKQHKGVKVQVAGHCDERGTVEYNLALGQRRAAAVRGYYIHLGVPAKRIATISYGKERPLCQESNEDCWAKNRRAETLRAAPNSASR